MVTSEVSPSFGGQSVKFVHYVDWHIWDDANVIEHATILAGNGPIQPD
jgi:hypothetical protein